MPTLLNDRALAFRWRGQHAIIPTDVAMTGEFFWASEGFHNSIDFDQAQQSIDRLAHRADIVIPGHGNAFSAHLPPEPGGRWAGCPWDDPARIRN